MKPIISLDPRIRCSICGVMEVVPEKTVKGHFCFACGCRMIDMDYIVKTLEE